MQEIMYNEYAKEVLENLAKGAFMTVSNGDRDNVMTIGWGAVSYMWRKPVFVAMVRYSRYTYEMLKGTDTFTISIPFDQTDFIKNALKITGTLSGRTHDKWKEANLTKLMLRNVSTPVVEECDLHYVCKIVGQTPLTENMLDVEIEERFYENGDYHMLYYGEILATYLK